MSNSARFAILPSTKVLEELQSDYKSGLDSSRSVHLRSIYGNNEFGAAQKETIAEKILEQFKNPLILLLLASAAVSVLLGHVEDAVSISLAILIVSTGECIRLFDSYLIIRISLMILLPLSSRIRSGISI